MTDRADDAMTASPTTDPHYLSDCHNAAVHLVSSDEGTNYYECTACKEGCGFHSAEAAAVDEQLDEILGNYGVGSAICVKCRHDVYLHFWNGTFDWDACRADGCKCIGEEIEREPNTGYECPLKTEYVVSAGAKAALLKWRTAAQQQLLRELMEGKVSASWNEEYKTNEGFTDEILVQEKAVPVSLIQHKLDEVSGKGGKA